jgi:hypothetical protein
MTEARDLGLLTYEWQNYGEFVDTKIIPKGPETSKQIFLDWYEILIKCNSPAG